ncbi:tyrosine-type recombinase/integrase [Devosia sp. 2618]|uniref:tyrosine-type recombinase/integrase n=1 Tax=Devosia sp. 2618 TaxID=3156454 RepID=UPI0033964306
MSVRKRSWTTKGVEKTAWVVDYTDGQDTRRLKTFAKKKDADQFAAIATVEVRSGTHVSDTVSISVKDAAEDWMKAVAVGRNGRSPAEASTLRQYRQHVDLHIVPEMGDLKLSKLTGPRIAAYRDHLLASMSRALAKKVLTSFKSVIKEAQARGNIIANPAAAISIHSAGDSRHKVDIEIPTRDEVRSMLVKLDELAGQTNQQRAKAWRRYRVLIATAVHTGFRASELRGLPWDAVNLKAGTIEVRQRADENGVIGPPKTKESRRKISIPAPLVARLREWKAECPPGDLVFPNWQGSVEALANIHTRAWKPLQIAAGVCGVGKDGKKTARYTFHALRHFRASLLIADGANPKEVQAELGHATIAVTMDTYASLFRDDAAELERRERAERLALSLT